MVNDWRTVGTYARCCFVCGHVWDNFEGYLIFYLCRVHVQSTNNSTAHKGEYRYSLKEKSLLQRGNFWASNYTWHYALTLTDVS